EHGGTARDRPLPPTAPRYLPVAGSGRRPGPGGALGPAHTRRRRAVDRRRHGGRARPPGAPSPLPGEAVRAGATVGAGPLHRDAGMGTGLRPPRHRAPRPARRAAAMTWLGADELDLLVLGSGVAGLSAVVRAAEEMALRVGVLTKAELSQAATRWAQGGVAAVLGGDPDSPDLHLAHTLAPGAGLCDVGA